MITLLIGFACIFLFLIGLVLLGMNSLIAGITFMGLSSFIGFFGWGILWFGNDWSLFFAKAKYFKNSGKGLLIDQRDDGRAKLLFINAGAKSLNLIYASGKDLLKHTIVMGKPFAILFGFGLPLFFHRQGALATSIPETNLEITDQAPQITDLLQQTAQTMRLGKKKNLLDNNLLVIILLAVAVIAILGIGMLIYQQGGQLTALSEQIAGVNNNLNSSLNAIRTSSPQPGGGSFIV